MTSEMIRLQAVVEVVQLGVVVVQGAVAAVDEGNGTTMAAMQAVVVAEATVLTTLSQVAIGRWRREWDFALRMTEFSLHAQTQRHTRDDNDLAYALRC